MPSKVKDAFGCGKSIVYGTYLYPLGLVDALYMLSNSQMYGIGGCQRPRTFMKIFGDAQDYAEIMNVGNVVDRVVGQIARVSVKEIVVDWEYFPE